VDRDGDDGKAGSEGVRSNTPSFPDEWLSIDDSVLERASIRFASFVGVADGEVDGVKESNIPERFRKGLLGPG